jgi:outer membrane protein
MKNISLILNGVLIVAVAFLYYLHFSGSRQVASGSSNVPITENSTPSTLKIAYVNLDSLLMNYAFYKETKELLVAKQKQHEGNLMSRGKELEKKAAGFQEKVDKMLVTRRQAEEMQSQLMQEQQELLQVKDKLSMQLMDDEQVMNRQVYDSITSFIRDYNKTHNYTLVLSNTAASTILYGDKSYDITKVVINGLNERYIGKKENK